MAGDELKAGSAEYARGFADGFRQGHSDGVDRGLALCREETSSVQENGGDENLPDPVNTINTHMTPVFTVPTQAIPTIKTYARVGIDGAEYRDEPTLIAPVESLDTAETLAQPLEMSDLADLADQPVLIESTGQQIEYDEEAKEITIRLDSTDEE